MKRAILIHGMNVIDLGAGSIDLVKHYLYSKGHTPFEFEYGWLGLLGVRFGNKAIAEKLMQIYQEGDVVIAHSNGCAITARAIDMGLPVEHCIFIHPALQPEWEPLENSKVKRIDVYYSEHDKVGRLAALYRWAAPLNFIFGPTYYGPMMTYGATSQNRIFENHNDGQKHSSGFQHEDICRKYVSTLRI